MKKIFLTAVLALTGLGSALAQADSDLVQLGVKGGFSLSNISDTYDNFEDKEARKGFYAGFVAEVPFSDRFSIQPEVIYSQQGHILSSSDIGEVTYKMDYINIPVLAKIYLIKGLNVQAGPQIGFQVNESVEYDGPLGVSDEEFDGTEDIELALTGGVEYKFDNGFFVQGRYTYGLSNLYKDNNDDFPESDRDGLKNAVFQVGIGFMF